MCVRACACAKCTDSDSSHACAVSSGHLLTIDTFYNIQWLWQRTTNVLIRLCACAGWSGPSLPAYTRRHVFMVRPNYSARACIHILYLMCSKASWTIAFEVKLSVCLLLKIKTDWYSAITHIHRGKARGTTMVSHIFLWSQFFLRAFIRTCCFIPKASVSDE